MNIKICFEEYETLIEFYEKIAIAAGYAAKDISKMQFDCTKLCVSTDIKDHIFNIMKEKQMTDFQKAEIWICFGPKTDSSLSQGSVNVEPGFFVLDN